MATENKDKNKDTYQPETDNHNVAEAILMLTADDTEDLEFFYPYYRFIEAGYKVDVATPKGGSFKAKHGLGLQETKKMGDVRADDYCLLYIPGGKAPAELKKHAEAVALTKSFATARKPIAAICHGPQLLAAAKLVEGREIAAWPEVKDEIEAADGVYVDRETVVDELIVTARWPGDLPRHMRETLIVLKNDADLHGKSAAA